MARKFKQLSYTQATLSNNNLIADTNPVIHLGVQGVPGLKFYINQTAEQITEDNTDYCVIDNTGIFELDLTDLDMEITSLIFSSIHNTTNKELLGSSMLIIDMIYED